MKYKSRSVTGDAGEYFFAYKLTSMFSWVVRLLDVDLGVDAEIEVVENEKSEFRLIKVQVKTSTKINGSSHSISVSKEHITYWKNTNLPVIVCLVDLKTEKIYWRKIQSEEDYSTSGESCKVQFDLTKHELTAATKSELINIAIPNEIREFEHLKKQLNIELNKLPTPVQMYPGHSGEELGILYDAIAVARTILDKLRSLILIHPNIGNNGVNSRIESIQLFLNQSSNYCDMCNRVDMGLE
ncbi:DUF4365 domain-containing protein [Pseudoalteromonas luteoviolacea]|uniref:DUF4365 domain-containing protein n=1 Tax=Pseudoalteromonas luteoviolacea TaxID=43657 RepID=UPI001B3A3AD9|nr:DUF4365 domain-containing protein [Pseudoalteromonas luteoviolacea]MBQ4877799.1 DUF4365 domain-containing protein [Pseudoalteromonas luteoviolacea]MBQ4906755.1 DUF4365 domain-containing protein [Pseudoalteromonas luteoviolacea]